MSDPRGRVAIVTGAGRGIGQAIAMALADAGAIVALWARSTAELDAVARTIRGRGGQARCDTVDLCDAARVQAATKAVTASLGPVDILVNNAGIVETAPLARITDAEWDRLMDVNVRAPYRLSRILMPGMIQRRYGRIVNVASTAALRGFAYTAAYTAGKHGLLGMTRALSREGVAHGVTVNAVCPGYVDTDIVKSAAENIAKKTGRSVEAAFAEFAKAGPLGRLITPNEVAQSVLLFVGPQSAALSGQALSISAGEVEG